MEYDRRQFGRVIGGTLGSLILTGWPDGIIAATAKDIYQVKKGDNLSKIAQKFDVSISDLKRHNWLSSDVIHPNQRLKIPDGLSRIAAAVKDSYQVKKGDNLSKIAQKFSVSISDLKRHNRLSSDVIHPGQQLKIPDVLPQTLRWQIGHRKINRRGWQKIIVHHSGTAQGSALIFHRFHVKRGCENGLVYHFVIGNGTSTADGKIEIGDRWKKQLHGGHVRSTKLNEISIGICLVGNFEKTKPTAKQLDMLHKLTRYLHTDLLRGRPKVLGHKDVQKTLCPGKKFPLRQYRARFA